MQTPTAPIPTKRTVSLAIAIIMLIVGAGVGAGVIYVLNPRATTPTTTIQNTICSSPLITNPSGCNSICSSGKTYTIGELLDLSKDLASQGKRAKASSAFAISDINAFLANGGCNLKFANSVSDYALDNPTALTQLDSFAAAGVQVVVGPLNSGAAQYILADANTKHVVLVSPSSTSPALAIANDYLFRTVPNDAAQGLADARMLVDRGATAAIILNRDDTYGNGLANATKIRFTALGGTVLNTIKYDPSITDFTTVLNSLQSSFNAAVGTYGAGHIAIDVIAFEEFGTMIIQAKNNYPAFPWSTLPWFGTDGEATDSVIIAGTSGVNTAIVRMAATLYATTNNTKTQALYSRFSSAYSPDFCDSYCLGAYDDVWLGAIASLQSGAYNGTAIQANLLTVAAGFYGVTGLLTLQPSGDRVPTSYQIWKAVNPGTPKWVLAGQWNIATDSITWTSPP